MRRREFVSRAGSGLLALSPALALARHRFAAPWLLVPMDDAQADIQAASHASRKRPGGPVRSSLEIEGLEHLGSAGRGITTRHAVQPSLEDQLAAGGFRRIGGPSLRHVADPPADQLWLTP